MAYIQRKRSADAARFRGESERTFTRACALAEIEDPGALHVELGDVPVAIVHTDGEIFAIRDVCSHAEVALSEGDVEGTTIECWLHGSRFDLRSGKPTGLPATIRVPVYPVRIEGDDVLVDLSGTSNDASQPRSNDASQQRNREN